MTAAVDFSNSESKWAGQRLCEKFHGLDKGNMTVVASSRNSAALAYYVAEELQAPWEVLSCKEIKNPQNPLETIGSVSDTYILLHKNGSISSDIANQIHQLQRSILLDNHFFSTVAGVHDLKNKTVILVCDYLKNFDLVAATLRSINDQRPLKTIVASVVVAPDTARLAASLTDGIVFLQIEATD